jgi:hypothetical protein
MKPVRFQRADGALVAEIRGGRHVVAIHHLSIPQGIGFPLDRDEAGRLAAFLATGPMPITTPVAKLVAKYHGACKALEAATMPAKQILYKDMKRELALEIADTLVEESKP